MAATVRGGSRSSSAKPRPKAPAQGAGRARSGAQAYAPSKLGVVGGVGLPPRLAVGITGLALAVALVGALVAEHRAQTIAAGGDAGFERALGGLGLRVANLTVQGATPMAQADIVKAAGVYRDQPILGVDLKALRQRIEQVGWVKQARVVRLLPDTIVIDVTQRQTLAVWQHGGHTQVIDNEGRPVPEADAGRFAELPLVVGEGANDAAGAILPLVRSRPRLMQRLDALVRVDDRRWDLRMTDGALIQLPPTGEDSALIRLDQLDQKSRILELGFARIDLRDPEMVAVRPKDATPAGQPVSGGA
ncbi:MAG: cell division protein FtsQ/DivIB [Caulobacteraceae bacterium]|nr:cell division protein FtsQ/DivIB [Caulobacteraceae bacterium]